MKSIHSEEDLKKFICLATGVELSGKEEAYVTALEWLNDPRRGYQLIDTPESALFWLKDGRYGIANFKGGLGLIMKDGGGCYGYFADG